MSRCLDRISDFQHNFNMSCNVMMKTASLSWRGKCYYHIAISYSALPYCEADAKLNPQGIANTLVLKQRKSAHVMSKRRVPFGMRVETSRGTNSSYHGAWKWMRAAWFQSERCSRGGRPQSRGFLVSITWRQWLSSAPLLLRGLSARLLWATRARG